MQYTREEGCAARGVGEGRTHMGEHTPNWNQKVESSIMNVHVLERVTRYQRGVEGSPDSNVQGLPTRSPRRSDHRSRAASH